mmetsp:Transcript_15786/g.43145  ORF Transcript_15786/g.43145 Transcript_15786/m.43145 type:complete len:502 (-) Transcript_15786:143-1648(-)|eukprot:CAMPEP_0117530392 /NCGR_PEP_ID=MMETSP0784-20121206/38320_1 /TAXON_ID=39447 /ORGANISM="" /LENGTH=501 /DNA_ID=CAMNT_0005326735 /DNA_START=35 /DNA_END=1540 /DNA_ORIENTATION=-
MTASAVPVSQGAPYYNQQGPYDDDDQAQLDREKCIDEEMAGYHTCYCLSPIIAGYIICSLTLLEGVVVLAHVTGVIRKDEGLFEGLDSHSPFFNTQWALLGLLGNVDLFAFACGTLGLWLSTNLMPWLFSKYRAWHADFVSLSVGFLFGWRVLVTIAAPVWVGIMLAFEQASFDTKVYTFWTLVYSAVNLATLWSMMLIYRVAIAGGKAMEEADRAQAHVERQIFVQHAFARPNDGTPRPYLDERDNFMFGCLPLELTVGAYTFVLLAVSIIWLFEGRTVGGWMFPLSPPDVVHTRGLEELMFIWTAVFAMIGLIGIFFFRQAMHMEDDALEELCGQGSTTQAYSEELELAVKSKRRSMSAMLLFFLANALRFCMFIPMTGLVLIAQDFCGIYVYSMGIISLRTPAVHPVPMHCTSKEWEALVVVGALMALDAYFAFGIYRLWRMYRHWAVFGPTVYGENIKHMDGDALTHMGSFLSANYGAADDRAHTGMQRPTIKEAVL